MHDPTTRLTLEGLHAWLSAAHARTDLTTETRRVLRSSIAQVARELGRPCPVPSRAERRAARRDDHE